ncbi:peptide ABC transporter permease [Kitasatospora phosalacinea]|uniref:Peptide ABC transporter permease n=1 Tax=Kitasatospora phosalacinea TaxID=2065 RepID=A0A9W6QBR8_9ACTN|nr:ABC transporter permease [Kitasatospora phosalacinea]GLW73897.1 peptide ABC transporter permease [Kitasatospora phosalacinea]
MKGFLLRLAAKLAAGLVMVFTVATFTFFLVHALPGNPGDAAYEGYVLGGMPPELARAKVSVVYGFTSHEPLVDQYLGYLGQLLHGNLGVSISYSGVPVADVIRAAVPWTVLPVLSGLLLSFLVGCTAGVVAALRRNSRSGSLLSLSGSLMAGVPSFVLALLLAFLFHTLWNVLPYGDTSDVTIAPGFTAEYLGSVATHAVLPVATYALLGYGGWLLTMKSSVASVLGDDFILAAELRGIAPATRMRYVGRNAVLPLFTTLALSVGHMFAGSVLIEDVFDYPGLGNLLLKSIGNRDYPLMGGAFLLITVTIVVANILAELLYSVIDPRVRR